MDGRSEAILDGTDRPLNLAYVTVGRDNVKRNREELVTNALEFVIAVHVANDEATGLVDANVGGSIF